MDEPRIEIQLDEYLSLKEDSLFLECLMGAGVDNWDGYEQATETLYE